MKKLMILVSLVSLSSLFAACGGAANTNVNNSNTTANAAKTNAATPAPSATPAPTAANNTNSATPKAQAKGDEGDAEGELQVGKTESVILYFGEESGDYAGYCFTNDSEAGKAILAACKDRQQCRVTGTIDGSAPCKVPGLEADLSASGRINAVKSVKSLGKRK